MSHIAFETHEYEAHYIYTEHGRQPYWAFQKLIEAVDGAGEWTFDFAGDTWKVQISYNADTGLLPSGEDVEEHGLDPETPLAEWWLKARPVNEHDRRKATFNISPRWANQPTLDGDELGTPFDRDRVHINGIGEVDMPDAGVDVEADCSNVDARRVPGLFAHFVDEIADELNVNLREGLFDEFHPISNAQFIEGYVRYDDGEESKVVHDDGVLYRLFHLLGDTEGNVVEYLADNEERVGHMHKVKVREGNPEQLVDGHRWNKQFKSYHLDKPADSGVLSNPKFGVLVHSSWQDSAIRVSDVEDVLREIEESGVNVLRWAGIDVDPETGPWVADDHFEPRPGDYPVEFVSDPTPKIEADQDAHLLRVISEGTAADLEMLGELAANGGEKHYSAFERASSTVYRMKQRLPELVDSDNGWIRTRSKKLQEQLDEMLNRTEREIGRLAHAVSNVLGLGAEYLDAVEGELEQFMQRYAVDFREEGSKLVADVGVALTEYKWNADSYPQVYGLVKRLRRLVHNSPRYDPRSVVIQYTNSDGVRQSMNIDAVSDARLARRTA